MSARQPPDAESRISPRRAPLLVDDDPAASGDGARLGAPVRFERRTPAA